MTPLRAILRRALAGPLAFGRGWSRSAITGAMSLSAAELVSTVLLAAMSLYLVRTLSTHEYGRAAFGLNISQLLLTLGGLGLGASVMAEMSRTVSSRDATRAPVHALLGIRVLSVVPVILTGSAWSAASGDPLPAIASVAASMYLVQDFLALMLAADRRAQACALVVVTQPVSYVVLLLTAQVRTAEGVLLALTAALTAALLLAVALLQAGTRAWVGWPRALRSSLPRAFAIARYAYLSVLLQIGAFVLPIIVLGVLGRFADAAMLSIILTLVRFVPDALGFAVQTMYFPRITAVDPLGSEAEALSGNFARLLGWLAIPAAVGLSIVGGPVVAVLFAGGYSQLEAPLAIASILLVLLAAESLLTWTLLARQDGRDAVLALGARFAIVLAACAATALATEPGLPYGMLIGLITGLAVSVTIQLLRINRRRALPLPAMAFTAYGLIAGVVYGLVRILLGPGGSEVAIVVGAGVMTLPLLAVGAWLLQPRLPAQPASSPT